MERIERSLKTKEKGTSQRWGNSKRWRNAAGRGPWSEHGDKSPKARGGQEEVKEEEEMKRESRYLGKSELEADSGSHLDGFEFFWSAGSFGRTFSFFSCSERA